jgi:hypothetical protein
MTGTRGRNNLPRLLCFAVLSFFALSNLIQFVQLFPYILDGYGDSSSFYASAKLVVDGRGQSYFDIDTQKTLQAELFPNVAIRTAPLMDLQLPFRVVLWLPLTPLAYRIAVVIAIAANFALLAWVSIAMERRFVGLRSALGLPFLLLMVAFYPTVRTLIHVQPSILILALLFLAMLKLEKGQTEIAGILIALTAFKFQFALPIVAVLALAGRWRPAAWFSLAFVALISISLLIVGIQGAADYITLISTSEGNFTVGESMRDRWNLRGVLGNGLITFIVSGLLVIGSAYFCRGRSIATQFSVAIFVALLVSYHANIHDWALAVLPLVMAADAARLSLNDYFGKMVNHSAAG